MNYVALQIAQKDGTQVKKFEILCMPDPYLSNCITKFTNFFQKNSP
jgi:hypothetical protein